MTNNDMNRAGTPIGGTPIGGTPVGGTPMGNRVGTPMRRPAPQKTVARPAATPVSTDDEAIDFGGETIDLGEGAIDFGTTPSTSEFKYDAPVVEKTVEKSTKDSIEEYNSKKIDKNARVIKGGLMGDNKTDPNKKNYVLYLIIDKPIDGMLDYFRAYDLNVSRIFSNIKDAKDTLLMQVDPVKIVVVDTGTGRFSSMQARKELIDLMGVSDEENRTTVFYCDTNLKSDITYSKEVENKFIEWIKYKNTAFVLAELLKSKSKFNYIQDGEYGRTSDIIASLDYVGEKNTGAKLSTQAVPQLTLSEIIANAKLTANGTKMIKAYTPILKNR